MWIVENRACYDRNGLLYPSDRTDDEWALVEPLIPPAKRRGNKRTVVMHEVVSRLMYVLGTGCQWRAIPKDLAPRSTVYGYFARWDQDGTLARVHHALYVQWITFFTPSRHRSRRTGQLSYQGWRKERYPLDVINRQPVLEWDRHS